MLRTSRPLALVIACLSCAGFVVSMPAQALPAPGNQHNATYVALGDSYSSGEGVNRFFTDTQFEGKSHQGCHRSERGYPAIIEQNISGAAVPITYEQSGGSSKFSFVACSGAVINNLSQAGAGNQAYDTPRDDAQLNYLGSRTRYATLSAGGNDAGFGPLIQSCLVAANIGTSTKPIVVNLQSAITQATGGAAATTQSPKSCDDKVAVSRSAHIVGLRKRLASLYLAALAKAPHARLAVMTYPRIFRPKFTGTTVSTVRFCTVSGWATALGYDAAGFYAQNVTTLNKYEAALNSEIKAAVAMAAAAYPDRIAVVDLYSSTTNNGLSCGDTGVTSFMSGALLQLTRTKPWVAASTGAFHPNRAGQAFFAKQILPVLLNPLTYSGSEWAVSGQSGQDFDSSQYVTGGVLPLSLRTSPLDTAPEWLHFSATNRQINLNGTPTASGTSLFHLLVTDARGASITIPVRLTVAATTPSYDAPIAITAPAQGYVESVTVPDDADKVAYDMPSGVKIADVQSGQTTSLQFGDAPTSDPNFSADGKYLTFAASTPDFDGDTAKHLYQRNLATGTDQRVSPVYADAANGGSAYDQLGSALSTQSADGRYVAYATSVYSGTGGFYNYWWLRDMASGSIRMLSVGAAGEPVRSNADGPGDFGPAHMRISNNGLYFAFTSYPPDSMYGTLVVRDIDAQATYTVADGSTVGNLDSVSNSGHVLYTCKPSDSIYAKYAACDYDLTSSASSTVAPSDSNTDFGPSSPDGKLLITGPGYCVFGTFVTLTVDDLLGGGSTEVGQIPCGNQSFELLTDSGNVVIVPKQGTWTTTTIMLYKRT